MKRVSLLILCVGGSHALFAQVCRPVALATDSVHRAELGRYIQLCQQQYVLSEGKGLVHLTCYQDAEGLSCWYLSALADDRYTLTPPSQHTVFNKQIILIYQGNQSGTPLPIAGDPTARVACLREVVGSRVSPYLRSPQYTTVPDATGKLQRVQVQQVTGGAPNHDLLLKFHKNGTVTRLKPV
jgi:hypothetical protein